MGSSHALKLSTKEIAIISVFASLWIASQIILGPAIHSVTRISGVINRMLGWSLMLVLARLSGKAGRVSLMSVIAATGTRLIRRSAYGMIMLLGYSLGGLVFDLLYSFRPSLSGGREKAYAVGVSVLSGAVVLVPYVVFNFLILDWNIFLGLIPYYAYSTLGGTLMSLVGVLLGLSVSPRIERVWLGKSFHA